MSDDRVPLVLCCLCARQFPNGTERLSGDDRYYCGPYRVGNSFLLCGKKEARFPQHCMVGPNWPCMLVTYGLIIGITSFLIVVGPGSKRWVSTIVVCCTCLIVVLAFTATACSDPGIVYRSPEQKSREAPETTAAGMGRMEAGDVLCGRCDVKRPSGARHCNECDVCVREHDHHCPWTGKCIGEKNIRVFYTFLISLVVHVVVVALLLLMSDADNIL